MPVNCCSTCVFYCITPPIQCWWRQLNGLYLFLLWWGSFRFCGDGWGRLQIMPEWGGDGNIVCGVAWWREKFTRNRVGTVTMLNRGPHDCECDAIGWLCKSSLLEFLLCQLPRWSVCRPRCFWNWRRTSASSGSLEIRSKMHSYEATWTRKSH